VRLVRRLWPVRYRRDNRCTPVAARTSAGPSSSPHAHYDTRGTSPPHLGVSTATRPSHPQSRHDTAGSDHPLRPRRPRPSQSPHPSRAAGHECPRGGRPHAAHGTHRTDPSRKASAGGRLRKPGDTVRRSAQRCQRSAGTVLRRYGGRGTPCNPRRRSPCAEKAPGRRSGGSDCTGLHRCEARDRCARPHPVRDILRMRVGPRVRESSWCAVRNMCRTSMRDIQR
jgi:hypothetical protein